MNITEDFVSYETAKLLKEKGFNIPIRTFYNPKKSYTVKFDPCLIDRNAGTCISAPTLQMAVKWLREVHNIFIQIELYSKLGDYCFEVFKNTHMMIVEKDEVYNTPEEACNDALKYVLEHLI